MTKTGVGATEAALLGIGRVIKQRLDGTGLGFVLLMFDLGVGGHTLYMSSADRSDVVKLLRETADRLEAVVVAPIGDHAHIANNPPKA